ncbi:MAG: hypothetical protein DWQ47_07105 [Acidobacteria bacterium]|nr:MAG: hypothetical protein DWQ32_15205 [Acidobacteriota bacterium]REJ99306.1 MAG: hypothetical protein DWQ38_14770 [Acidobacteriota bacterium]REK15974.1 MAG: hypothetical protein DWQ43_02915 [Acidobacteriota bacterium]REK43655.1 MAG: hypothetical protein DWQ47_07105 [Acidobacteriota bacterium]
MYCSECGTQSASGLKYCKSCGARISRGSSDIRESVAKTFSMAAIFVGVFGLIGFAIIVKELIESGANFGFVLALALIYLSALVAMTYILVNKVLGLIGIEEAPKVHDKAPPVLSPKITSQLEEHREPASVVEETTRDLGKVPIERNR